MQSNQKCVRRRTYETVLQLAMNDIGIVRAHLDHVKVLFDVGENLSHFRVFRLEIRRLLKLSEFRLQQQELILTKTIER